MEAPVEAPAISTAPFLAEGASIEASVPSIKTSIPSTEAFLEASVPSMEASIIGHDC